MAHKWTPEMKMRMVKSRKRALAAKKRSLKKHTTRLVSDISAHDLAQQEQAKPLEVTYTGEINRDERMRNIAEAAGFRRGLSHVIRMILNAME